MFSMNDDPIFAARAIEIGGKGYVSKTGVAATSNRHRDPDDLVEAIREVGKGGAYLPSAIARRIGRLRPGCYRSPAALVPSLESRSHDYPDRFAE
jgi:two-component system, NarL family, invasion response regulator UvrY